MNADRFAPIAGRPLPIIIRMHPNVRRDLALLSELDQEIAATLMARYRIDELKSGDVSLLIGLLGKIGFSPNERDRMNITALQ